MIQMTPARTQKRGDILKGCDNKMLVTIYRTAANRWIASNRTDREIYLTMQWIEEESDRRGMDTDAMIESLFA
jgi:hypothetical protein